MKRSKKQKQKEVESTQEETRLEVQDDPLQKLRKEIEQLSDTDEKEELIHQSEKEINLSDEAELDPAEQSETRALSPNFNLRDSDSDSDEQVLIRTGNIPQEWYEEHDHLGYSIDAKPVMKQKQSDKIDEFIERATGKNWWRKIRDELNNRDIILTDEQLSVIHRIREGAHANKALDPYSEKYQYTFNHQQSIHPLSSIEPKRRFQPSKHQRIKVNRIIKAVQNGWIKMEDLVKSREEREKSRKKGPTGLEFSSDEDELHELKDVWGQDYQEAWKPRKMPPAITAPKREDPLHAQSYNPPAEYLHTQQEKKKYEEMDQQDRPLNYEPKKYSALRKVPLYDNLIQQNFQRCLDLFMCPRLVRKKKEVSDPSKLIPELTNPNELRPFPSKLALSYGIIKVKSKKGVFKEQKVHSGKIKSISVDISGKILASADELGILALWDIQTTKLLKKYILDEEVACVEWNKLEQLSLLSFSSQEYIFHINPKLLRRSQTQKTDELLETTASVIKELKKEKEEETESKKNECNWIALEASSSQYILQDQRIKVKLPHYAKQVVWHSKGDYFATLANYTQSGAPLFVHSLSKAISQRPFSQSMKSGNAMISSISFHPTKPYLMIATQRSIYAYNLQKQSMVKKFEAGARWVSSIAVHPKGDNFLCGTYDKKTIWFDFDIGSKPLKSFQRNEKAVRSVAYHQKSGQYPLFVTGSDDGSLTVFYGMVYSDAFETAKILPLKILKGHKISKGFGVMDVEFHPKQPWVFSCGADGTVKLWTS